MGKRVLLFLIFMILANALFAQVYLGIGGGVVVNDINDYDTNVYGFTIGPHIFVDATYIKASLSVGFGGISTYEYFKATRINISLVGKFPINLGFLTLFPQAGVGYNSFKFNGAYSSKDLEEAFTHVGFIAGLGLDLNFTNNFFLRPETLFHFIPVYWDGGAPLVYFSLCAGYWF